MKYSLVVMSLLVLLQLTGCGNDVSSDAMGSDGNRVLPAGKTTLVFSAISTAKLSAPISGIAFNLCLPPGMTVETTSGSSGQILNSSIVPGSSLSGTNLAFGSYSASTRKSKLEMVTTSDSFRAGEFLRLYCTIAPNNRITLGQLMPENVMAVGMTGKTTVILPVKILTGAL